MERQKMQIFFQEHKASILETWFDALLKSYSPEAARIFKREKDPFANPVGYNIHLGLEGVLDWLIKNDQEADVSAALDKVVRVLAVQDFTPSQAVSFLIVLKRIIKKQMNNHYRNQDEMWAYWQVFDAQVDKLMLTAMDIYTDCREKLYQIKVDEANKRVFSILRRANVLVDSVENFADTGDDCDSCDSCETEKKAKKGCKNEFTTQS
ncbi:MAG: RsbRD N-terminal domain-containing protein [Dehalobacterium sp.]